MKKDFPEFIKPSNCGTIGCNSTPSPWNAPPHGMTPIEMVNCLSHRVDDMCGVYNSVMRNCYETLHNLEDAARENGAYYHKPALWYEEGYNGDDNCKYHIIHKSVVDDNNKPILMEMKLAYNNTTDSGITEKITDKSYNTYANVIFNAQNNGASNSRTGKVIYNGAPIPSEKSETGFSYGFTKSGVLKVYNNATTDFNTMINDGVVNSCGCLGVLALDGEATTGEYTNYPSYTTKGKRVVIGQNMTTREVFILTVGSNYDDIKDGKIVNDNTMYATTALNILLKYGCDIVVDVSCNNTAALYEGKPLVASAASDEKYTTFWVITREHFYKDDYTREVARLVQNYGTLLFQVTHDTVGQTLELQEAVTALTAKIDINTGNITINRNNINNLENEFSEYKADVSEQFDDVNTEITANKTAINKNASDISALEAKHNTDIDNIEREVGELSNTLSQHTTTLQNINSTLVAINADVTAITTRLTNLEIKHTNDNQEVREQILDVNESVQNIVSGKTKLNYLPAVNGTVSTATKFTGGVSALGKDTYSPNDLVPYADIKSKFVSFGDNSGDVSLTNFTAKSISIPDFTVPLDDSYVPTWGYIKNNSSTDKFINISLFEGNTNTFNGTINGLAYKDNKGIYMHVTTNNVGNMSIYSNDTETENGLIDIIKKGLVANNMDYRGTTSFTMPVFSSQMEQWECTVMVLNNNISTITISCKNTYSFDADLHILFMVQSAKM